MGSIHRSIMTPYKFVLNFRADMLLRVLCIETEAQRPVGSKTEDTFPTFFSLCKIRGRVGNVLFVFKDRPIGLNL